MRLSVYFRDHYTPRVPARFSHALPSFVFVYPPQQYSSCSRAKIACCILLPFLYDGLNTSRGYISGISVGRV